MQKSSPIPGIEGMTLRDWFAGQALAGLAHAAPMGHATNAIRAYQLADSLLEQRAKTSPPDSEK